MSPNVERTLTYEDACGQRGEWVVAQVPGSEENSNQDFVISSPHPLYFNIKMIVYIC
jgi:hypothetical protein